MRITNTILFLLLALLLGACEPCAPNDAPNPDPVVEGETNPGTEGAVEGEQDTEGELTGEGEATSEGEPGPDPDAPLCASRCTYEVIASYPHDPEAFTQGLVYENGLLYEGTGLRGKSTLRMVELETGTVLQSVPLARSYFGEGITIFGDRILQLTWTSKQGFIYDKNTFSEIGTFTYDSQGWGITHDGTQLIMSDGTPTIRFLDPDTFAVLREIEVRDANGPLGNLNELEYVRGEIYANVWQTNFIVAIDPATGQVKATLDLQGLLPPEDRPPNVDVLNGIAYDVDGDRLFVTGKNWPKLFHIRVVPS